MLDNSTDTTQEEIEISFGGFEDALTSGGGEENDDPINPPENNNGDDGDENDDAIDPIVNPENKGDTNIDVDPKVDSNVDPNVEEESTFVSELIEGLGFENLNAEDYEDSAEGIKRLTMDAGRELAGTTLDKLFESMPTVKAHMEYLQNGGDPQNFAAAFAPPIDFARIKLEDSKEGIEQQKFVVGKYLKATGNDDDFINDIIEQYEDKGVLFSKSGIMQSKLVGAQDKKKLETLSNQANQRASDEKAAQDDWKEVQDTIRRSSSFAGISVSESEKIDFEAYISKPVNSQGQTKRDVDAAKLTLDQQLGLDMLIMRGVDLSKFAATKGRTKETETLRQRLSGKKPRAKSSGTQRLSEPSQSDVDLGAIF